MKESYQEKIGTYILSRIGTVHGIQLSNEEVMKRVIREQFPDFNILVEFARNFIANNRAQQALDAEPSLQNSPQFIRFEWGSDVHNVPEGFKMPQENVASVWKFWIFGCARDRLHPLRLLQGRSLSDKSQHSQLSKARFVMNYIQEKCGKSFEEIHALGIIEAERLCKRTYDQLMGHVPGHDRMYYSNVYIYFKSFERNRLN